MGLALLMAAEVWVLWLNVAVGAEVNTWEPVTSFRTLEACEVSQAEYMRGFRPPPDMRITGRNDRQIMVEGQDGMTGYLRTACLPANVNPRR